jgi:SAM-dependent methyltransferase
MTPRLPLTIVAPVLACLTLGLGTARAQEPPPPSPERMFRYERQAVTVPDFPASGWILDVGAGGEGIIGQLKGAQVVGIDLSERELREAPPGPLKIVMDAAELKFLDGTFNTVTCFFTMMYIPTAKHDKVFAEVARVMSPGARFLLWDPVLTPQPNPTQDIAVVPLTITLPTRQVQTGYGVRWPPALQDVAYWTRLGERAALKLVSSRVTGRTFFLEFQKPQTPGT